jgi:hypothetical protein
MVLNDLTSRDAVLAAIEEFDALGRDEFLKTYHFAQARDHFILHGGRRYDSKAIAGVAYGKQFPDRGPLEPGKFHGGDPVIRALERLGFDVRADADAALTSESKTETESRTSSDERSAWIFQANPALYDLQGALQKLTDLPWLVKQHRDAIKRGDTVYLWEGGADAGIVAIATVTGEPAMRRQNPEEADFNREPTKFAGDQLRVSLHIERVLQTRVRRIDLREHPVLKNMTILKAPQGTNFALSVDEFQALNSLIPRGTMALTIEDLQAMMAGFAKAGFRCIQKPTSPRNPIAVEWRTGQETRRYRLWAFDILTAAGDRPSALPTNFVFRLPMAQKPLRISTLAAWLICLLGTRAIGMQSLHMTATGLKIGVEKKKKPDLGDLLRSKSKKPTSRPATITGGTDCIRSSVQPSDWIWQLDDLPGGATAQFPKLTSQRVEIIPQQPKSRFVCRFNFDADLVTHLRDQFGQKLHHVIALCCDQAGEVLAPALHLAVG